ncbi:ankyrin repeat domain-containing protein [Photobacterium sp. 1_MG-2023]|uniref:ankyrin repeat domain-containing protein n=1 Tax=Photobacterium sp. 1_MG-2023 TaxID=3062646 RepID=UPI0026E12827|nr:ankyrin repeat domain-containing protein [Photobacterium sp. 1_MG-2023]MDO6708623.1 ankyrin repeat domain-containing protein [Photobacterium sp. 1_MG-2023]
MRYIDSPEFKFFQAIKRGQLESAENLLNQGVNVHHVTENDRWTYLHKVLTSTSVDRLSPSESIQFLIDQGLDVNAIDSYGYTPLIYAVRQRNVPAMRLLLDNGAKETLEHRGIDSQNALDMAFDSHPFEFNVVKVLLEYGSDPDAAAPGGKSVREAMDIIAGIDPAIKALMDQY